MDLEEHIRILACQQSLAAVRQRHITESMLLGDQLAKGCLPALASTGYQNDWLERDVMNDLGKDRTRDHDWYMDCKYKNNMKFNFIFFYNCKSSKTFNVIPKHLVLRPSDF